MILTKGNKLFHSLKCQLDPQLSKSHLNTELPKASTGTMPPRAHFSSCHSKSDSLPSTKLMDCQK